MNFRFLALALALTGCTDLIKGLAKNKDAGDDASSSASTADPSPTDTPTATSTSTAAATAPLGNAPAKTTAAAAAAKASPADLEKAFAALDINKDNQLDGIEVKACNCIVADANGDGEITKAEYLAAGLVGKFKPGAAPTALNAPAQPTAQPNTQPNGAPTQPTPPTPPPPAPVGAGLPVGTYDCEGKGLLQILSATRYAHGSTKDGGGSYVFDPGTKKITFTSGIFADPEYLKDASQISDTAIRLRVGKTGGVVWTCRKK